MCWKCKKEIEFVRRYLMLDGGREERPSSGRRGNYLFDGGGGGGCIGYWWSGIGGMLALGMDAARGPRVTDVDVEVVGLGYRRSHNFVVGRRHPCCV